MCMDNVGSILPMSVRGQGVRRPGACTLSFFKEQGVKNVGRKDSEGTEGVCLCNGLDKQSIFLRDSSRPFFIMKVSPIEEISVFAYNTTFYTYICMYMYIYSSLYSCFLYTGIKHNNNSS